MRLVLIETSGNQGYIFGSNRLAQNVGASQLVHQCGTDLVSAALDGIPGAQPLVQASGKALVVVPDGDAASQLIWSVTSRALVEAPGVHLAGVSVEYDPDVPGGLMAASRLVHRRFGAARTQVPGPERRFLRLPPVASCTDSHYPASVLAQWPTPHDESVVGEAKRQAALRGFRRMHRALEASAPRLADQVDEATEALDTSSPAYAKKISELEAYFEQTGRDRWIAVVHIDGNGVGKRLSQLDVSDNEEYARRLEGLTSFLSGAADGALEAAVSVVRARRRGGGVVPFLPLVFGGDDTTFICDGADALDATVAYMRAFEALTTDAAVDGPPRHGAKAGIAIVKPHYPFSAAYGLAEELTGVAGQVKAQLGESCSALDFHVLHDASGGDLRAVRERITRREGDVEVRLTAGPYVVSDIELDALGPDERAWAAPRRWEDLVRRVAVLQEEKDGRTVLPNSQVHALRDAINRSVPEAETAYAQQSRRHPGFGALGHSEDELFRTELFGTEHSPGAAGSLVDDDGGGGASVAGPERADGSRLVRVTPALDAMMAADFLAAAPVGRS